jgi:hypothetical protein
MLHLGDIGDADGERDDERDRECEVVAGHGLDSVRMVVADEA